MTASGELRYDVLISGLAPVRLGELPNGTQPHWSPLSHTLIYGPSTAVLVDPPVTRAQTAAVADWIAAHGRDLGYVYITHWHADHWLGTRQLLERFPAAVVLAGPATLARIRDSTVDGAPAALWSTLFGDQLPDGGLESWHQALDLVAALRPRIVVAGHKDATRPDTPANIDETRRYLDVIGELLRSEPTRTDFFFQTLKLYPDRINPTTVWLTAQRLLRD